MRSLTLKQHLLHLSKVIEMQGPDKMANSNVTSSKPRMEEKGPEKSLWSPSPGDSHQHSLSSSQAAVFLIKINSSLLL